MAWSYTSFAAGDRASVTQINELRVKANELFAVINFDGYWGGTWPAQMDKVNSMEKACATLYNIHHVLRLAVYRKIFWSRSSSYDSFYPITLATLESEISGYTYYEADQVRLSVALMNSLKALVDGLARKWVFKHLTIGGSSSWANNLFNVGAAEWGFEGDYYQDPLGSLNDTWATARSGLATKVATWLRDYTNFQQVPDPDALCNQIIYKVDINKIQDGSDIYWTCNENGWYWGEEAVWPAFVDKVSYTFNPDSEDWPAALMEDGETEYRLWFKQGQTQNVEYGYWLENSCEDMAIQDHEENAVDGKANISATVKIEGSVVGTAGTGSDTYGAASNNHSIELSYSDISFTGDNEILIESDDTALPVPPASSGNWSEPSAGQSKLFSWASPSIQALFIKPYFSWATLT